MDTGSVTFFEILLVGIGAFTMARGVLILVTGKLSSREEARIGELSENGMKRYKLLLAIINMVCGGLVVLMSIVEMVTGSNNLIFSIIILAVLVVMIILFIVARNSCKKVP